MVRPLATVRTLGLATFVALITLLAALPRPANSATVDLATCTKADLEAAITAALASQPATVRYTVDCTGATDVDFATAIFLTLGDGIGLTIDANGNTVDFNGNAASRIFALFSGDLTLKGVKLMNAAGDTGAAIRAEGTGTVTLEDTTFTSNATTSNGGGIWSAGPLVVTGSTFTSNSAPAGVGGAVFATNSLTVRDSTFTSNAAVNGGALDARDLVVFISGSTFSLNTASGAGGIGGALYHAVSGGSAVVVNSTFKGNSAASQGGAIYTGNGSPLQLLFVTNSTFSGNSAPSGGAIGYANNPTTAKLQVRNSIFAASTGGHVAITSGTYHSSLSLYSVGIPSGATGSSNQVGDAGLGALQDNGGPTHTMAITGDSPAYQAADDVICTAASGTPSYGANAVDQRGETRDDARCSMGAFEPNAALVVDKTDAVDPVLAGENLTYTITVANDGPDDAYDARLQDTLPSGTTFVSMTFEPGWTCEPMGPADPLDCSIATFAEGATATFTLEVMVASSQTADLSNAADATATNAADASEGEATTVNEEADLGITKSDDPDPVIAGTEITYTITVSTAGPSDAQTVEMLDTLPAGATFVSLAEPAGWSCTTPIVGMAGTVDCDLTTLAADAGDQVFTLVVFVAPSQTTDLTNDATVTSATSDPNTPNNGTAGTTVDEEADVRIEKLDTPDPIQLASEITYTITITNDGPSDAQNVDIVDVVPAGTTFVSASDPGCGTLTTPAVGGIGAMTCADLDLASGASVVWTIVVKVDVGVPHGTIITNTATITGSGTPEPGTADPANNTATTETVVGDGVKPRLVYSAYPLSAVSGTDTSPGPQPAGPDDPAAFGAWRNHRMVVYISCFDDLGPIGTGVAVNTYPKRLLFARDGSHVVNPNGRCVDGAGNVADEPAVGNIMVDTRPPTCGVRFSRKAKIGATVAVTVNVLSTDATSGVVSRSVVGLTPLTGVSPAVTLPAAAPLSRMFMAVRGSFWEVAAMAADAAGNQSNCRGRLNSIR